MKEKFPLNYKIIQQIKAQEYERFFSRLGGFSLYMNHLGEVRWLKDSEASRQHEFFHYSFSPWERLKRHFRLSKKLKLSSLHPAEKELRLRIRKFLEETYIGEVKSQTAGQLPPQWAYEIDEQEINQIPISMDFGREEIWKRLGFFALFITVLFAGLIYWALQNTDEHQTALMVKSDVSGGRVYAEGSGFLGYTNRLITNIPPGIYRITARKEGYQALPPSLEINLPPDSQLTVSFDFKKIRSELMGFLKVVADHSDSKIFIDDVYYGLLSDNEVIELDSGKYEVSITKDGYVNIPPERFVVITAGDTSIYAVQQVQTRSNAQDLSTAYAKNVGSIEVSSNISGAEIMLNGRDTGELTDHVFTQLPPGRYSVMLRKEGYLINPEIHQITLSSQNPAGVASFTLKKNLEIVTIRTVPPTGKIFIDGDEKGVGEFKGFLSIGEHQLSFGSVPEFVKPRSRQIDVTAGIPLDLTVKYFPHMEIMATVNNRGTVSKKNCTVTTGYTFKDRAFTASSEGGPAIEFNKDLNGYFWKLGYAFPYRNPKGNDAVKLTFELPRELDFDQQFTFKLYGASSKEKYPLSISSNVEINIKLNNNVLSYSYNPKFVEDLGDVEVKEWDISSYIRGGVNTLEISTTDKNNTFYYLKKLEIFN